MAWHGMTENTPLINQALELLQQGELEKAKVQFNTVLAQDAQQADALHGMGLLYAQQNKHQKAVDYFLKAIQYAPNIAPFHNNVANSLKALGQSDQALTHYHETLKLQPNHANALNNIGVLLYKQGRYRDATEYLKKSVRINPKHANTHFNLALCYIQLDLLREAKAHLEEVLKLEPNHHDAKHNLGIALCTLQDYAKAADLLADVCEKEANFDANYHAGIAFAAINQHDKAISHYLKALKLNPQHAQSHHNLAISYLHNQDKDKAITHFERACALDKQNKTAEHMLKALKGEASDEGAPIEYTRALFNQYALHYDEHVTNTLKLQVPQLLRRAFSPYTQNISAPYRILDIGCGTGLCATFFNDLTDIIIGVDVSENMLMVAKQRGGYAKLHHSDALGFLQQTEESYDAIIISDTLVYFGELTELFKACCNVLNPNGFIGFSVEALPNNAKNFTLTSTGRYQHNENYLNRLAKQLNIKVLHFSKEVIRQQDGQDILGYIVLWQLK